MKTLILLLSLLFPVLSFGQVYGTLQGKVIDKETKEELPFVNITLEVEEEQKAGVASDIDGTYKIQGIMPGKYDVRASFIGYTEVLVRGVQINANQTRFLDIEMKASSIMLDECMIIDYKVPLIDKDKTVSGGTVTQNEIRKMPNRSVGATASTIGGVYSQDGGSGNVRGARTNATRYYVDGMPVNGSLSLPQSAIAQQQVILGGTPASQGSIPVDAHVPDNRKRKRNARKAPAPVHQDINTESYSMIVENEFQSPVFSPLSTFSIDVDVASYSNVRRFISDGSMPPGDAVRIEEMINYFTYDYPDPENDVPFSVTTELADCPWSENLLLHVGIQGKRMETDELPPTNLVFLLDVSGSMSCANKLPLLKKGLKLLVGQLRKQDRISIVVYAGSSGLALPSTRGSKKEEIIDVIDNLHAGGSTAGGAGIQLAYKVARQNFMENGNNRIILATDGDFNVGITDDDKLVKMIEEEREHGIFLSVLGFGTGNLQDQKMEKLADNGNGNYSYIDNLLEAQKVLVSEMGGTLFTIAKDVKIQIEFNPENVVEYRLIGYENRILAAEDFNNDKKDAGEIGAGQSVTALYEIVTEKEDGMPRPIDDLKYSKHVSEAEVFADELGTLKIRYKDPDGSKSKLIVNVIENEKAGDPSENFIFSSAVAEYGMLLRDSGFKGHASYDEVISNASDAKGTDEFGYRAEFVRLAMLARDMQ